MNFSIFLEQEVVVTNKGLSCYVYNVRGNADYASRA